MAKRELDLSGLDDINLDGAEAKAVATGEPMKVPFSEVYEDPENPRTEFNEDELQEMTDSIIAQGILQPIVVWPKDERGYKIQFGAQRRRAAERASKKTGVFDVKIVVNADAKPAEIGYAQVHENNKRHNLSPMDMAKFIRKRLALGDSQSVVADTLGMPKARISNYLSLLELPALLKAAYDDGRCRSPQVLYALVSIHRRYPAEVDSWLQSDEEITRNSVARLEARLVAGQLEQPPASQTETSESESAINTGQTTRVTVQQAAVRKASAKPKPDADIASLERRMTATLGSRTTIQYSESTKSGTVRIRFTSLDVLDGLLQRFNVPDEDKAS